MIGIATETFDTGGAHIFKTSGADEAVNESGSRRCTRTSTLDGGCVVYDTGYSDSDKTIIVKEKNSSETAVSFAKYIVKNYRTVLVATCDGVFRGVPESWDVADGTLTLSILITEKLSL